MTASIGPLENEHLPGVQAIVNAHLEAVVPGWALPINHLAERLRRNPEQWVLDPWVIERQTLCALEAGRVTAAAHLLRYGAGPEVGPDYQNAGDVAWFVFWPGSPAAGASLLVAAQEQLARWGVGRSYAWDAGLPVGMTPGVPDVWPHVAQALAAAGYTCQPGRSEAMYGGGLAQIAPPAPPPWPGLAVLRTLGRRQTRFTALAEGQAIGWCECSADLTQGGALPALRGWAELGEIEVDERWRNRGVGTWLIQHAAAWLRLGGCDRAVFAVAAENEAAGAGRLYRRLGWNVLTRHQIGWQMDLGNSDATLPANRA